MGMLQTHPGTEGIDPALDVAIMIATTATVIGDVVGVTLGTVDSTSLKWTTVDTPATADLELGILMVAMEVVAAGAKGRFCLRGHVDVQTTSEPAVGAALYAADGATTLTDAVAGANKVWGYACELGVTGTATRCYFDGWAGVGNDNA